MLSERRSPLPCREIDEGYAVRAVPLTNCEEATRCLRLPLLLPGGLELTFQRVDRTFRYPRLNEEGEEEKAQLPRCGYLFS